MKISGVGLHTGQPATVRFFPSQGPVRFIRKSVEIPALAPFVVDTARATVLGREGQRISTVEHLLAALWLKQVWTGWTIEVDGPELPILDGSAREWLALLSEVAPSPIPTREFTRPVHVEEKHSRLMAERASTFSLTVSVIFEHPRIGYQSFAAPPERLAKVADARTFGFAREAEALRAAGLIQGASMENALVYGALAPLNEPRGFDEPVRHKALDFLGDLYLLGAPMTGRFRVHRGSHRLHVKLVEKIGMEVVCRN